MRRRTVPRGGPGNGRSGPCGRCGPHGPHVPGGGLARCAAIALLLAIAPAVHAQSPASGGPANGVRSAAPSPAGLPLRNLLVQVRQTDAATASGGARAASGTVRIDSHGGVSGQAGVPLRSDRRAASADRFIELRVLNGAEGRLRISQATPWQFVRIVVGPQGVQAEPGTAWTETADGFVVRPRWAGGREPVLLEIAAEASGIADLPGAPTGGRPAAQRQVLTTLAAPLDEWVTVARAGSDLRSPTAGVVSSRDAERRDSIWWQVRVTLP
jgi:hypothetical protein